MRLGIFGGTFDPPHTGHLLVASDAAEALALDRVVFIPAAEQPLKAGVVTASAADRLAMVRALVGDDPRFAVDPVEIDRGGLSYTVDTLKAYADRFPDAQLFFLLGTDAYASLAKWREPERIRALATLVVLQRVDGNGAGSPPMARSRREEAPAPDALVRLATRRIDISSTEIRARVRAGASIHGFVPDRVAAYIQSVGLYK